MGYTYSFFDNQTIGAADLNKLAKRFASEGVADMFKDGVPYNISILNAIISANVSDGTVPETDTSLKVIISNSKAFISAGTAIFADGTVMEVDAEGISLPFISGKTNYIYLISDTSSNSCRAECTQSKLSGNVLLLATIDEKGKVTDKRKYAKGKIPSAYASDRFLITKKTLYWSGEEIKNLTPKEIEITTNSANGLFTYVNGISKTTTFGFVVFGSGGRENTYISGCVVGGAQAISSNPVFTTEYLIIQNALDIDIIFKATASVGNGKVTITPFESDSFENNGIEVEFFIF